MPANTIWAVGRNYKDHAKEMNAAVPKEPLIFQKAMACLSESSKITIPPWCKDLHFETELAVLIGEGKKPISIALALDLTARDAQTVAKEKGLPWTQAKSFKGSCPIGNWQPFQSQEWFDQLHFDLHINGQLRQQGKTSDMIFSLPTLFSYIDEIFPVQEGDIILTGTPAGVGPLHKGDKLKLSLSDSITHDFYVGE